MTFLLPLLRKTHRNAYFYHNPAEKIGDFTTQFMYRGKERLTYTTVGIMGGYRGMLVGMRRLRSSCIWGSQHQCATQWGADHLDRRGYHTIVVLRMAWWMAG